MTRLRPTLWTLFCLFLSLSLSPSAQAVSVSGSISPSSLPSAGGALNVIAVATFSAKGGGVEALLYEDRAYSTYIILNPMPNGTYTGSFSIGPNPDYASHTLTVLLRANDGNGSSSSANASGACTQRAFSFTGASISPASLPSSGGALNVTGTVTNPSNYYPTMQAFLYEDGATGNNYTTYIDLNTSDGATYTGSFSIGPNPDYSGHTWTVSVVATDGAGVSQTITASPCTQGAFSFTGVNISPTTLPSSGGTLNVTGTVTNPSNYYPAMQALLYEDGAYNTSIILNTSDGATYTGSFSIGPNPDYSGHTWTVSVVATDGAGVSQTITASPCTQGAFSFTGVNISPTTLPSSGGALNVTATVTNPSNDYPAMQALLYEDGAYNTSIILNTSDGATYTGSFSIGPNPDYSGHTWTVSVVATDGAGVSQTITASPCTQGAFSFTGVNISPTTLPSSGGTLNVTGTVTNPSNYYPAMQAFLYEDGATGSNYVTSVTLSTSDGATYTGSFNIPANNTNDYIDYSVTVIATDGAGVTHTITSGLCRQATSQNQPAPTLTALSPTSAFANANVTLTLTGTNFGYRSEVLFGTVHVIPYSVAATKLIATVPASAMTPAGTVTVKVLNDGPGGGTTAGITFTILPSVTSVTLSPADVTGGASSTGTVTLTGTAPVAETITLKSGTTSVATVPTSVTVNAGHTTATFTVTTVEVGSVSSVTISATGGPTKSATLTVNPPAPASLTLNPTSLVGGASSTGTVTLASAPAVNETIALTSGNTSATVPASVTVSAGSTTATFTVMTTTVTATASAVITATAGGVSKTATLTINPVPPTPKTLTLSPTSVTGGSDSTATITLTADTPSDLTVNLASNNAAAVVPPTATVPANTDSITFAVVTSSVTTTQTAAITATANGGSASGTLTITPATTGLPTVTSFTPTSGPIGTVVTVTGTNLNGVTAVRFHNANATTFSANAQGTQLTVTVPTGAGTGTFTITTPAGSVKTTGTFTVTVPPTVTSFTPTSGPIGTVVTVTGTNLNGVTAVRFHNANATTFSANAQGTQLTVTVPTGAGTGTFTITTPGGSIKTTGTFTVN